MGGIRGGVAERRVGFVCWYMAWSFASFLVEFLLMNIPRFGCEGLITWTIFYLSS
jgi:hypothetical protein